MKRAAKRAREKAERKRTAGKRGGSGSLGSGSLPRGKAGAPRAGTRSRASGVRGDVIGEAAASGTSGTSLAIGTGRSVSTAGLMEAAGCSRQTVQEWVRAGLPRDRRYEENRWKSFYDLDEVAAWLCAQGSERQVAGARTFPPVTAGAGSRGVVAVEASESGNGMTPEESGDPIAAGAPMTIGDAKLRLALANLEYRKAKTSLEQINLAVRRGELLDAREVERGRLDRIAAVTSALEALPAAIAPVLEGRGAQEIQAILSGEVRRIRAEFAGEAA